MPELPEVEYATRCLRAWMIDRHVDRAIAERTRVLQRVTPARLSEALSGRVLQSVERRGKYLLLQFDENVGLLGHLGMTGKLVRRPHGALEPYSHARFELDDGWTVHFRDPRKFGRLRLARADRLSRLEEVKSLGPDALGITATVLAERLKRTARPIKVALLDQTVVAGLGNIYAAEALFLAQLSPRRRADRLTTRQVARLAEGIRQTLEKALAHLPGVHDVEIAYVEEPGTPNPFLVYDKEGKPCSRCGAPVRSLGQGGRTTFFCSRCQR